MAVNPVTEQWPSEIFQVTIGAEHKDGGNCLHSVTVGGEKTLPFLFREGAMPNAPRVAFEIWDTGPENWPEELVNTYGNLLHDPLAWAEFCVSAHNADLICVKLAGAHPDYGDKSAGQEAAFITSLLKRVSVPLVIVGCGDRNKDNLILPAVSEAAHGQRCLIGSALQDNYKTIVGAVLADGHSIIAESPIDINIAKQLNILISDMGLPLERIVMDPTIGALGYGLEYAYSIMERSRLAALSGDKTLANPFICFVGQETWRAKEAWVSAEEFPHAGSESERGIFWEVLTATALLQAGADILVMRHPTAIQNIRRYIENLMTGNTYIEGIVCS